MNRPKNDTDRRIGKLDSMEDYPQKVAVLQKSRSSWDSVLSPPPPLCSFCLSWQRDLNPRPAVLEPLMNEEGNEAGRRDYVFIVTGPWDFPTLPVEMDGKYTGYRFDAFSPGWSMEDKLLNQIIGKTIKPNEKNVDLEWWRQYEERICYNAAYGGGVVPVEGWRGK